MRRKSRKKTQENIFDNFDIEQFVSKELVDKFTLWTLRIFFNLRAIDKFLDENRTTVSEEIASFLGLQKFVDNDNFTKKDIFLFLRKKHRKYEGRKKFTTSKVLKNNINKISKITDLNCYEKEILEFSILLNEYEILQNITEYINKVSNVNKTKKVLSVILNIPLKEIDKCFSPNSKLTKSTLLIIDYYGSDLNRRLEFITDSFPSKMLSSNSNIENIIKDIVYKCENTDLKLKDYKHLEKELSILIPYLENSIQKYKKGVNILFYGVPGTGKTELTKVIANKLNKSLYEISYSDSYDEPIDSKTRLKAYKSAQSLLSNKDIFLMFDEIEDVLITDENPFFKVKNTQKNKAWINRILENNLIPTVWITNDVNSIDRAVIRRFDMAIEVPIPSKLKRIEIMNKFSANQLAHETISKLASNETIAPALVSRASKVISTIEKKDKNKAFEMIIKNTLKAQGHNYKKQDYSISLPKSYNPSFINSDINLNNLADGIKENANARLCLYGPAGTGKSAYGKYIANYLEKPLIVKKGSDLIGMFVGETEKNIAKAFEEAKEENAVLVFDEVDSFLANRENANKNWEVTQVNEMLVQMENFDGIFIATTNLMDNLDRASLRRFDLKLEFNFLESKQAFKLFKSECEGLNIENFFDVEKEVKSLAFLTPGDFAAVLRQNRFMPIKDAIDFCKRLKEEVDVKELDSSNSMGFIN